MINFWRYCCRNNNMRIFIKYISLIFLLVGLTISCVSQNTPGLVEMKPPKKRFIFKKLNPEFKKLKANFKKTDDTGVTKEGKKAIVSSNNKFALNLYSYLSSGNPNENIFFSSYGIFTAMAMAYEGASGQTANEMRSVFFFLKMKMSEDQQ